MTIIQFLFLSVKCEDPFIDDAHIVIKAKTVSIAFLNSSKSTGSGGTYT